MFKQQSKGHKAERANRTRINHSRHTPEHKRWNPPGITSEIAAPALLISLRIIRGHATENNTRTDFECCNELSCKDQSAGRFIIATDLTTDVLIIGAGIVGCSIALSLSREGFKTLNLDTLPAAGYGSTSHSSAIVRPFYSHETSCAIAHESRSRWQQWPEFLGVDDTSGFANYTESGGLILLNEGQEHRYDVNIEVLRAVGVEFEMLDASGVAALYPGISLQSFGPPRLLDDAEFGEPTNGRVVGGIYIPATGYVSDPQLAAHNLQTAARAHGASFQFNRKVVEILRKTDSSSVCGVRLNNGETVHAPLIVNAAGPHSAVINELAGITDSLKIKTQPHRHEVVYLTAPPGYLENGNGFLVDTDCGLYTRPDGMDLLIGSADPECDAPDVVDPDDYNTGFTRQWTLEAYRAAQRFPQLGISNTARGTVALYDVSDDWIPIYDRSDLDGFYLAIGTSGNQFKNAPLIGDLLTAIIQTDSAGPDSVNHDQQPAQLSLSHLGRSVDLSFYSRNRTVGSTRSVMA